MKHDTKNHYFQYFLLVFISLFFVTMASFATERLPATNNLCAKDTRVCGLLAIEVAKLDLYKLVNRVLNKKSKRTFLCPEDNPNCCPPKLMPMCKELEKNLVADSLQKFQNSVASSKLSVNNYKCPFSANICDSLGSLYCGLGNTYTPWGCLDSVISDPPNWPDPLPLPCPCGQVKNSGGICVPKVCTKFGLRVTCNILCDLGVNSSKNIGSNSSKSNLTKHLTNHNVQLKAARLLREELKDSLKIIEEQIEHLSKKNH